MAAPNLNRLRARQERSAQVRRERERESERRTKTGRRRSEALGECCARRNRDGLEGRARQYRADDEKREEDAHMRRPMKTDCSVVAWKSQMAPTVTMAGWTAATRSRSVAVRATRRTT